MLQTPAEATWGPAPPFVPAGAQIAVLSGDPGKPRHAACAEAAGELPFRALAPDR